MLALQVSISDITNKTKFFSLAGPDSSAVLEGLEAAVPQAGQVAVMGFQNSPVVVAEGSGLASPGFCLVADEQAAAELWLALVAKVTACLSSQTCQVPACKVCQS